MEKNPKNVNAEMNGSTSNGSPVENDFIKPVPDFRDCMNCMEGCARSFTQKINGYDSLPIDSVMSVMIQDRFEMKMRNLVLQQDHIGILDKLIEFKQSEITKENEKAEKKRIEKEAREKAMKEAASFIQQGAKKIVLDVEEGELARIFKSSLVLARNKKNSSIYIGSKKDFAIWMSGSIILKNGHEMNYLTIENALSRIE